MNLKLKTFLTILKLESHLMFYIPSSTKKEPVWRAVMKPAVIGGALGYFVDIYDPTLSNIVLGLLLITTLFIGL